MSFFIEDLEIALVEARYDPVVGVGDCHIDDDHIDVHLKRGGVKVGAADINPRTLFRIDSDANKVVKFYAQSSKQAHRFPMQQVHGSNHRLRPRSAIPGICGVLTKRCHHTALKDAFMFGNQYSHLLAKSQDRFLELIVLLKCLARSV